MIGNNRTLDFKEKKDIIRPVTKSFEVSLSFGKDQIGVMKMFTEIFITIFKYCPGGVRTVRNNFDDFVQTGCPGIGHGGVIEDGKAPHGKGYPRRRELFD